MRADFMKGSVLDQLYNGSPIEAGTKVRWGSTISLVVGAGLQAQRVRVPDLVGLTVAEAKDLLKEQGILLAAILTSGNVTDTANAFVFKQNPDVLDIDFSPAYIQPGQTMDIWVQITKPVIDSLHVKIDTTKK